ncbi:hypothetical protein TERTU_1944 [Teredinibacter turnerae T7901]|uniref:Uncharacterized protein n=1 Tax=Teredinibacter turnerae (strain ATCC 39867 / T7901) TaxID=377629 RepID=C5BIH7_TERTT|nr:hypothetical protein TERTU_1944 [Teredinibacter turnerae T7901]
MFIFDWLAWFALAKPFSFYMGCALTCIVEWVYSKLILFVVAFSELILLLGWCSLTDGAKDLPREYGL